MVMGMTRQERIALHKKQERLQVKSGDPSASDLEEGVPVLRTTSEGVVEYVKHSGELYKKVLDKANEVVKTAKLLTTDGYQIFDSGLIIQWGQTDSAGAPATVTFTLPFSNACFVVCSNSMVETAVGSTNWNIAVQTYDYTKTNFKARVIGGAGANYGATNDGFAWIAIGY